MNNNFSLARRFLVLGLLGGLAVLGWQSPVQAQARGSNSGSSSSSSGSGLGTSGTGQGLTGQQLLGSVSISNVAPALGNSRSSVQSTNPFSGYYVNPYSLGVSPSYTSSTNAGNSSQGSFGSPIYATSSSSGTSNSSSGGRTSAGFSGNSSSSNLGRTMGSSSSSSTGSSGSRTSGSSGYGTSGSSTLGRTSGLTTGVGNQGRTTATTTTGGNATGNWSTVGQQRTPSYGVAMGNVPIVAPPVNSQLQARVQGLIVNSSSLPSRNGITVGMVGDTVVLHGAVSDDHERRLAENMVRMTPGVRTVQNNLTTVSFASNRNP